MISQIHHAYGLKKSALKDENTSNSEDTCTLLKSSEWLGSKITLLYQHQAGLTGFVRNGDVVSKIGAENIKGIPIELSTDTLNLKEFLRDAYIRAVWLPNGGVLLHVNSRLRGGGFDLPISSDSFPLEDLQNAVNLAKQVKNKDVVLFSGPHHSGKSTAINFLLGIDFVKHNECLSVKDNQAAVAKIGHDSSISTTQISCPHLSKVDKYCYIDAASLGRTHDRQRDILAETSTRLCLTQAKSVKLVLCKDIPDTIDEGFVDSLIIEISKNLDDLEKVGFRNDLDANHDRIPFTLLLTKSANDGDISVNELRGKLNEKKANATKGSHYERIIDVLSKPYGLTSYDPTKGKKRVELKHVFENLAQLTSDKTMIKPNGEIYRCFKDDMQQSIETLCEKIECYQDKRSENRNAQVLQKQKENELAEIEKNLKKARDNSQAKIDTQGIEKSIWQEQKKIKHQERTIKRKKALKAKWEKKGADEICVRITSVVKAKTRSVETTTDKTVEKHSKEEKTKKKSTHTEVKAATSSYEFMYKGRYLRIEKYPEGSGWKEETKGNEYKATYSPIESSDKPKLSIYVARKETDKVKKRIEGFDDLIAEAKEKKKTAERSKKLYEQMLQQYKQQKSVQETYNSVVEEFAGTYEREKVNLDKLQKQLNKDLKTEDDLKADIQKHDKAIKFLGHYLVDFSDCIDDKSRNKFKSLVKWYNKNSQP